MPLHDSLVEENLIWFTSMKIATIRSLPHSVSIVTVIFTMTSKNQVGAPNESLFSENFEYPQALSFFHTRCSDYIFQYEAHLGELCFLLEYWIRTPSDAQLWWRLYKGCVPSYCSLQQCSKTFNDWTTGKINVVWGILKNSLFLSLKMLN